MDLLNEIRDILSPISQMDADKIMPRHKLMKDLGIDSFGIADAVAIIEKKYKIIIPDKQLKSFVTVQDVLDYITKNTPLTDK